MKARFARLLTLALLAGGLALGQSDDDVDPGRGVARLSLLNGDVSVRRGDSGDWIAGVVNAPLVTGDAVLTGTGSRCELQLDWANMIRLAATTEVRLAELANKRYMLQVARGLVTFRVQRDTDAEVEISTPSVSVRPMRKGTYRILVRDDGSSEITVRSGEAEIFTPRGAERLRAGKTMEARGDAADPEYRIVSAARRDAWDQWNEDRDRYYDRTRSYRYVGRSVCGADDLDGYGAWVYVAPYGWVWAPRVSAGWAPYYNGRWTWIDWYGWTWISYDPWGWAPFHYGRWFYHGPYGWCWFPGAMHVHQHWRPALVAFFGWGGWSGASVGVGVGRIGWVPLAPYEPYYPWYGRRYYRAYRDGAYVDNSVHIVNNTNIVNVYKNARVNNGIIAVDAAGFGRAHTHVRMAHTQVHNVDLVRGQLPLAPGHESLRMSDRHVEAGQVRAANTERFFSRREPARIERAPFSEQQKSMEQLARRIGGGRKTLDSGGAVAPREANEAGRAAAPREDRNSGGRRIGEPERNKPTDGGVADGWRRFGGGAARPEVRRETGSPGASFAPRAEATPAPRNRTAPAAGTGAGGGDGGWRRFEGSREAGPAPRTEPRATDRARQSAPGYDAPRTPSGAERLRISPPLVREREAPRTGSPRSAEGRSRSEAPRTATPRAETAPAPRPSAPSGRVGAGPSGGAGRGRAR